MARALLVERRIGLLFALLLTLLVVSLGRAVWIQGVQGAELSASATSQQTDRARIPAPRGAILDRNGQPLAVSEDAVTVYATPYQVAEPAAAARELAPVLGAEHGELAAKLSDRRSGFAYLARQLPSRVAARIDRLDIEGIGTLPDSRRVYPQGFLASQVIGTVGVDGEGLSGLEAALEPTLRGRDGLRRVVKDARGQTIDLETERERVRGREIQLTLDGPIQAEAEKALRELGRDLRPKGATAIVMDPRSSEILAMANWPGADANELGSAEPEELANRASGFVYEPGSTFKAFTVAAALEEGAVTPETRFELPPTLQVADREIKEAHERGPVTLRTADILAQSSNVGSVKIGMRVGAERFDRWIRRFGFGTPTGIAFPGEERGLVPPIADYSGSTMGNLPIGQGLSVTPLQMMAGYATITNGGILRTPRLVRSPARADRAGDAGEAVERRVISAETARSLRRMLAGVLKPGGTAAEVRIPGYQLGGKTGTAEKVIDGEYSKTKYVASFVGFAPVRDPRLLIAVVVDEPQGSIYGAQVAAPAFGEIASFALPHLGIAPR